VNLPASLISISSNPFRGCVNLTTITVDSNNPQFTARDDMLLDKAGTTVILYPSASGTVTLSDITSIDDYAFDSCTGLTSVSFPEATSIGDHAFYDCTSLTSVSFPEVISIRDYAFIGCTSLTSVSFPEVTSIGDRVFGYCTSLTSISFPKVTSIGYGAFGSTGGTAQTITLENTPPTVGRYMFDHVNESKPVTVRVPASAVSSYDSAWQDAFKGKGSDGSGDVNTDIALTIEGF
jgi:hypothetical protein